MTRDAELFYLQDCDCGPIKEKIEFDQDAHQLRQEIAIFNYRMLANCFIVLSMSKRIDKIVLENGGQQAPPNDLYKFALKEKKSTPGDFIFGREDIIEFLPVAQ